MDDLKQASWVPKEVINFWSLFSFRSNEFLKQDIFRDIDLSGLSKEERLNFERMIEQERRYKLFLEKCPRLFVQFEEGPGPQHLWERVKESKSFSPTEFLCAVKDAFGGHVSRFDVMTRSQRDNWPNKVITAAHKLRELIDSTNAEDILAYRYKELLDQVLSVIKKENLLISDELESEINYLFSDPPSLSVLLHELASDPEKNWPESFSLFFQYSYPEFDGAPFRPNDRYAHRAHFIRAMTNYFYQRSGKPERGLIQILVRALFDQDIDKRRIIDIAPTPSEE